MNTERQIAEYWEAGWKRLLHNAWRILGATHPMSSRIGERFLRAGRRSTRARAIEKGQAVENEMIRRHPDTI